MKKYLLIGLCLTASISFSAEGMQRMSIAEVKVLCTQQAGDLQKNKTTAPYAKKAYESCLNEYVKLGVVDSSILTSNITKLPETTSLNTAPSNGDMRNEINEVANQFIGKKVAYDGMNQPSQVQLKELLSRYDFAAVEYYELDFSLPESFKPKKTKHTGYPSRAIYTDSGKDVTIIVYLARKPTNDWLFVLSDNGLKSASWKIIDVAPINSQNLSDVQLTSAPDCKLGSKKISNWVALLPPPKIQGDYCKAGKKVEWTRAATAGNVWSINAAGKIIRENIAADVLCFSKSKDHCKNEYDDGDL